MADDPEGWFAFLALSTGQVVSALLCVLWVAGTITSLVEVRSRLPLLQAVGWGGEGPWLVLGVVVEGAVGFFFWAGLLIVFTRAKRRSGL